MLVLSRKTGEQIVVPKCELTITILHIAGNRVRVGVSAPSTVSVHRKEVWQQLRKPPIPARGRGDVDDL